MRYAPEIFDPADWDHARRIVFDAHGVDIDHRWATETEWQIKLLDSTMTLDEHSRVLDFGVGVGRLAKAVIDRFGCTVHGCDISSRMLDLSRQYVNSHRYHVMTYDELRLEINRFTHVVAAWSLQHVLVSSEAIDRIVNSTQHGGYMFICELHDKAVPRLDSNLVHWVGGDPGLNRGLLMPHYDLLYQGIIPDAVFPNSPGIIRDSWWGFLRLR